MAFNSCTLFIFLLHLISGLEISENILWFKNEEIPYVCCDMKIEESEILFLTNDDKRIQGLGNFTGSSELKRLPMDEETFLQKNNGWTFRSPEEEIGKICITKLSGVTFHRDDQMTFVCSKTNNGGLGATLEEKKIVVRVYLPASVTPIESDSFIEEGGNLSLVCQGRGYPGLNMSWKDSNGEKVSVGTSEGNGELIYRLSPTKISDHGALYTCAITTDYPSDQQRAETSTRVSIALQPEIHLSGSTIYTTLGVTESITFNVSGLPTPDVNCENLQHVKTVNVSANPRGGTIRYTMTTKNITLDRLGHFKCRAINAFGVDEKVLLLTIKPSQPEVISPRESQTSDYYLIGWQVNSRVPLANVTLDLEELPALSDPLEPPAFRHRTLVYPLGPGAIDNKTTTRLMLPTDETTLLGNKWRQIVWHHLPNLSDATQHKLRLMVCNQYACHDDGDMEARSNTDPVHVFITPKFNGTNKVDPRSLLRAPVDRIYMASNVNQPSGSGQFRCKPYFQDGRLLYGLLQVLLMSWILRI